ncbi:hypothetical protein MMC30_009156 [Trapelia coarctata]|nr:hypothetical protein [Trapelia coarctata]
MMKCKEDNCLRDGPGSVFPTRHGSADCASHLAMTVTPATSTITTVVTNLETTSFTTFITDIVTITTAIAVPPPASSPAAAFTGRKREAHGASTDPKAGDLLESLIAGILPQPRIPAYASPCSGSVRYTSACSYVGATQRTLTAPTPLTTVTATIVGRSVSIAPAPTVSD